MKKKKMFEFRDVRECAVMEGVEDGYKWMTMRARVLKFTKMADGPGAGGDTCGVIPAAAVSIGFIETTTGVIGHF